MTKTELAAVALSLTLAAPAGAQVADHLKCYKVKDPLRLGGTVDLGTPQFGVDPGCRISKAKLFCVPATKTNVAVVDKATKQPITPLPVTGPDPGDRICYTVKCPAVVADQQVTDQFGTRTLSKFKIALVCTPAVKGTAPTTTTTTAVTTTSTTPTCGRCWLSVSNMCMSIGCSSDFDCQGQPNMFCRPDLCPAVCISTTSTSTTTSTTLQSGCFQDWGDGTIHDTCTDLQWEKKTTTAGLYNVGNRYTWAGCCAGDCSIIANYCQPNTAAAATCMAHADGGTEGCSMCATSATCNVDPHGHGAVTTVWDWLNQVNGANFAGHNDWRLPKQGGCNSCWSGPPNYTCSSCSPHELETILLAPYPCGTSPCVDSIFGPTATSLGYWSASTSKRTTTTTFGQCEAVPDQPAPRMRIEPGDGRSAASLRRGAGSTHGTWASAMAPRAKQPEPPGEGRADGMARAWSREVHANLKPCAAPRRGS